MFYFIYFSQVCEVGTMIPRGSERVGYLPKGIQLISVRIEESISSIYAPMGPLFPKFQLPC